MVRVEAARGKRKRSVHPGASSPTIKRRWVAHGQYDRPATYQSIGSVVLVSFPSDAFAVNVARVPIYLPSIGLVVFQIAFTAEYF